MVLSCARFARESSLISNPMRLHEPILFLLSPGHYTQGLHEMVTILSKLVDINLEAWGQHFD